MALFSSNKIFKTKQQIKDALYQVKSLDYRQRPTVYNTLVKELDDGGVSKEEIKRVVSELRQREEISEVDKKNLLKLIQG
ncbi:MAG: hypothetical protein CMI53_05600 [Parcubacteria group bacterium]|nr:hypothetical protein [Parcubacteria group bacterium]|tara:strand:- start:15091 stop:15330 length:240 start_codon:yes stop_codon:yes gene_type:complete